jgi:16S rRNA (cytosine967-C5)-methyltransferase
MSGRVRVVKRKREGDERADKGHAVSHARRASFEVLRRVEDEGAFAAPLLAGLPGELSSEDRSLCYELTLGVLRRQLWLDRALEHFAGRASDKLDAPVRRALRLGLYQLQFLTRVPARAAVNESVNLVHAARLRSAAPFVNAVLRRAAREPDFDPAAAIEDPIEKISVEASHPAWLIARWAEAFGREEAEAFARANNDTAPAAFRVNTLSPNSDALISQLRDAGLTLTPSLVAPDGWRVEGGSGSLLRGLAAEGKIYSQDEASQLVAHVVGAREGERVLDVCAAPGSKTTHIAALADDRALVVAGDLYEHRLRTVAETCARLGVRSVQVVALNAERALPFADGTFDRVLVDAPCTGTGTLRHNPEIRWRLAPENIRELSEVQSRILREAARVLRPGGRLVYSTCSVEREENEEVVDRFLNTHADFRQLTADPAPSELLLPSGAARTWPQRDDVDGFFVAALTKG